MCEVRLQRQSHHLTRIREVFLPAGILKAGGSEYSEGIDPEIVQIPLEQNIIIYASF